MSNFRIRDALLKREAVIADDAVTAPIDLGELTECGSRLEDYEVGIFAEADNTGSFPPDTSAKFSLEFSSDLNFIDPDVYSCNRWAQTGSVVGTEALEVFFRVPKQCPRYMRLRATLTGDTGTAAARFGVELLG